MSAVSLSVFASGPLPKVVATDVAAEARTSRDYESAAREKWQEVIDYRLIEWGRDPSQLEDEGVEPPTGQAIRCAIGLAQAFRDAGLTPPDSIVPDPNGGIVFERREKDVSEVLHVWDDGTREYFRFQGTRLAERRPL
jgi:hypothetical protein